MKCPGIHRISDAFFRFSEEVIRDKLMDGSKLSGNSQH